MSTQRQVTLPANGIMDNGSKWTSSTGTWIQSGGANPYGSNSLYSKESGATYTFQASGVNGNKKISLWWTEWSSRCDTVPVGIYDGNTLIKTVYVNHQLNGGKWNSLGTYSFSGTARVVINSQGIYSTSADACKIEAAGPTSSPALSTNGIMDNGSKWASSTGTWIQSGGANPYGSNSLYSKNSGDTYTFQASEVNGSNEISLWWTEWSSRCGTVPVGIYDGNTLIKTVYVNHQLNGGKWNSLGTYSFSGTARVVINSQGIYSTSADACKIVKPVNNPPVLSYIGNKSINVGQTLNFTVSATDPDGNTLNYTASNLPFGASFNKSTSTFSWTPTYDQAGTYPNITFQVSDGSSTDSQNVTITVINVNRPPVLDQIAKIVVSEGVTVIL